MSGSMFKLLLLAAAVFQLRLSIAAEPSSLNKIDVLPGQPSVNFCQYSGYIKVGAVKGKYLFYYFVEAETDPDSKPLVLWLNGGPGCSSFGLGAFSEHGPFRPSGDKLLRNEYSWNIEANMLYLETPAGVGFSYYDSKNYSGVDDGITARENFEFLQSWYNRFPQYRNRSFFITGESYAGHYVPQLAELIVNFNRKEGLINLKGIALGNPLLEFVTDFNSRAEYLWSHGLISDSTYEGFTSVCNYSKFASEQFRGLLSSVCADIMMQVRREISKFVDNYDVTLDVCSTIVHLQSRLLGPQQAAADLDVCLQDETTTYLNREDVQKAIHAQLFGSKKWSACTSDIMYQMLNLEESMVPTMMFVIKSGIRVLVYSGDQDSVIPLTGTRTIVQKLAQSLQLDYTAPYRVWFSGKQVGGWTQNYGDALTFATVRGASHTVPFSQPQRSLVFLKAFLQGHELSDTF